MWNQESKWGYEVQTHEVIEICMNLTLNPKFPEDFIIWQLLHGNNMLLSQSNSFPDNWLMSFHKLFTDIYGETLSRKRPVVSRNLFAIGDKYGWNIYLWPSGAEQ